MAVHEADWLELDRPSGGSIAATGTRKVLGVARRSPRETRSARA
jgi:hypothetical protein